MIASCVLFDVYSLPPSSSLSALHSKLSFTDASKRNYTRNANEQYVNLRVKCWAEWEVKNLVSLIGGAFDKCLLVVWSPSALLTSSAPAAFSFMYLGCCYAYNNENIHICDVCVWWEHVGIEPSDRSRGGKNESIIQHTLPFSFAPLFRTPICMFRRNFPSTTQKYGTKKKDLKGFVRFERVSLSLPPSFYKCEGVCLCV